MQELEEKIAHLTRAVDDLSDTVARQETVIALLNRRVQLLLEREAERETAQGGQDVVGDSRPPHW
ncbi:SlyX family protein [Roseovarius confluentis]|jgi:SlyX protein|uniref:SlyX family protein n=1 Tax=Roseovarius confluentis TaxID=1852027 RepID=UPI000CDDB672|nr:SlyX family protein [Roseovarius confluentis]